jgi:FixJ family two-component response regulator
MGDGPTIFVVDDDEVVRDSLRVLLESRHFDVLDFGSGAAFLAHRAEAPATPGCLLLDVHMPEMSGIDLLRRLRSKGDDVAAILVTGRRDAATQAQAEALGAVALLDKPLSHPALFGAIDRGLKRL